MGVDPEAPPASTFSEREFYLREFRGRTLAIALPEASVRSLSSIRPVLEALGTGGCRALVLAPDAPALEKALPGQVLAADHPRLEGEVWRGLHRRAQLGIAAHGRGRFDEVCHELALRLGISKLVRIDPGGGLFDAAGVRKSFVHLEELEQLLAAGGAGLARRDRLPLWRHVAAMLEAGLPAVNVCSAEGLDDELFTYAGSGTLFTRDRYMTVRRLGVDDFDAAHDLMRRGVAEGYLVERPPEEVDAILASGFGAFVEGRHLAGIGALLAGGDGCSGEIVSLYTLTRFLGEGVGDSLVAYASTCARALGHGYVYACTTSERVGAFFERNGFRPVGQGTVPRAKWRDYDPARRGRVRCYRRDL